jgi:NAD(P)-dependent dehydrogenase (short-subunit alcohol dehydrogenase family)
MNLTGVFLCSQAAGRVMLEQRSGVIVNLASIFGVVGIPLHGR